MMKNYSRQITSRMAAHQSNVTSVERESLAISQLKRDLAAAEQAQQILQEIAAQLQQQAHHSIATIVSDCLSSIFEDPYDFKINFESKRGKTEATLVFERDGNAMKPIDASGGGVVDVAAFALRLASLLLAQPQPRSVLILDEPFKFLSADYRAHIGDLLMRLAVELDIQIILVTHIDELQLGKVVNL